MRWKSYRIGYSFSVGSEKWSGQFRVLDAKNESEARKRFLSEYEELNPEIVSIQVMADKKKEPIEIDEQSLVTVESLIRALSRIKDKNAVVKLTDKWGIDRNLNKWSLSVSNGAVLIG